MTSTQILEIFTGFIGSVGFAILFNLRGIKLAFGAMGGLFSWAAFIGFNTFIKSQAVCYFLVAVVIATYAEVLARVLKTPTTTFLMTSLIPLIPGGSLYYTMVYAFGGNTQGFATKAIYTLQLASALALGIITVTAVAKIITNIKRNPLK